MKVLTALLTTVALLMGSAPAAHAETGSFTDPSDPGVAHTFDIRSTRVANGDDALVFTVTIERPRRRTHVFVRTQMNDEPGWLLDALAWRNRDGDVNRLFLWPNTQDRDRIRCPRMTSSWTSGGRVRIRIPNSCIYGPRPWRGFRSGTYSGDAYPSHFVDDSRSRESLELSPG